MQSQDARQFRCKYFNTETGCKYGNSCLFAHIPGRRSVCKFFRIGLQCNYGDNCIFAHETYNTQSNPSPTMPQQQLHPNRTEPYHKKYNKLSRKDSNSNWEALVAAYIDIKSKEATTQLGGSTVQSTGKELKTSNHGNGDASLDVSLIREVAADEAAGRLEPSSHEAVYACSHCGEFFKGQAKLNKLQEHYYLKLSKAESVHMKLLRDDPSFREETFCSVCGLHLKDSFETLVHCGEAALSNNEHGLEHQDFLKEMAEKFMGLEAGFYKEEDIIHYAKLQLVASSGNSFVDEEKELSQALEHLGLENFNSLEDSCGVPGFTEDELEELMCQGIKPWEPEARAALSVLYDH